MNIKAVHGSDFLIISWNNQRDVPFYRILFANPRDEVGPTPVYCLPDNTTCSYCVSNLNTPDVSCITLNSHYTASISIELDYEQLVSVRVEACKELNPEECLQRSEWTNYTIPPGGKLQLNQEQELQMESPTLNWDFQISMVFTSLLGVKWSLISFNRSYILFCLASVRMSLRCLFFSL